MHPRPSPTSLIWSVWCGYNPVAHDWGYPIRQLWALSPQQEIRLGLHDCLPFTVTATGTYEQAAAVATKWGCPIDDARLHALAQRLGAQAERSPHPTRLAAVPTEITSRRAPSMLTVLMLDGWRVRQRGAGWGRPRTKKPRVEWHELKMSVAYRCHHASQHLRGMGGAPSRGDGAQAMAWV